MSYVEHGPRIFLASRHSSGTPLIYGDYVLPKKRLEGRLKLHDSCQDIRAWSPNCLENSRYFRELSENDSPMGKIIPFNVVIDNIIRLNSQAQNELQTIKKELQKYKALELTPQQRDQLKNFEHHPSKTKELINRSNYTTGLFKDALINTSTSNSVARSNSCLSIHIPCERQLHDTTRQRQAVRNQSDQLYSYSLTAFDVNSCLNNYNLVSPRGPAMKSLPPADYHEKRSSCVECIDVDVQVERETRDAEIQVGYESDGNRKRKRMITVSAISQTSFASKSSEDNSAIDMDKSSLQTNNQEEQSSECDASCSDSSQDIGSPSESDIEIGIESDSDLRNSVHKGIIIQKDSEIIVLKNELCVREAELEELIDMNKQLEILLKEREDSIHGQQANIKMLHDKLYKLDRQYDREVDDLKQKLCSYKCLVEQLKQDLDKKCETCYAQSQEIEKLRLYAEEAAKLRLEKDSKRLQELDRLVERAEDYGTAVEQLKNALQERDELRKQNYQQNCLLEDQEEKLNQLLKIIKEMSVAYNEQMEAKNMSEELKMEIRDKDIKIYEYQEQLVSVKQEITDFFNNLKTALNNLEEMNEVCEDICSCTTCDLDIGEEANNILYNINIIMTRFQSYKTESQNLLQQMQDLKYYYVEGDKGVDHNRNLKSIIYEDFYFDSETEYNKYICKLSRNDMDDVERQVIDYLARFLIKLRSLINKLQIYVEFERPLMIKQTYYFYEILRDTQSAVNVSEDVTLRRQLISDLYNQHKEERERYNSYVKQLPNDLLQVQSKINQFIQDILYQLLNQLLHAENEHLCDEKINQAFETHFRSCINRINGALQGAGDQQRMQIVETIEEQQKELKRKDVEIARLKQEIAQRLERKGDGDCLNTDRVQNVVVIKEHLSRVTAELDRKDALLTRLEEQLEIFKNRLTARNEDCSILEKRNKSLKNAKNRLSRRAREYQKIKWQLNARNKRIENLTRQIKELGEAKRLTATLENNIRQMEKELIDLQSENISLVKTVNEASVVISTKDQMITSLKNNIDRTDSILSEKITEYENTVEEKCREIVALQNENKLLNEKVKDIENKLVSMNRTIEALTEENDKIHVIYTLQEDLTKLDKNEKKLKVELNNLKVQLINDQNKNKKLDNSLEACQRENEFLKKNIEYWKSENSELSTKLRNEEAEKKLKNKLYTVSNSICERLINLKKLSVLQKDSPDIIKKLQDKYMISREKEIQLAADNVVKDLKAECRDERRDIRENEIEPIETQLLHSKGDTLNSNYASFKRFMHAENEQSEDKNEIDKLLSHIENRDCEIKHHKEIIKTLTQENAKLRAVLKSQIEEYQDKLTLMKKNYDSSLNALCERHKANIEILQKQFEDNMRSEQIFDSENWLLSLNLKELMELHQRISVIVNRESNVIHMENENQCLYDNADRQQFYSRLQETQMKIQLIPTNMYEKEPTQNKIVPLILKEEDLHLQNQWITSGDSQRYPTLQAQSYKPSLEHNFGYFNNEGKSSESENKYEKEKHMEKDSSFDRQRWNFINQCSAYHKLSNVYEYTRTFPTD